MRVTSQHGEESPELPTKKKSLGKLMLIACAALVVTGVALSARTTGGTDGERAARKEEMGRNWLVADGGSFLKAQSDAFILSGRYTIIAVVSGKALAVEAWSKLAGARILQWDVHGFKNEEWVFERVGGSPSEVFIKSGDSGLYMDMSTGKLIQAAKNGGASQQFRVETLNDGNVRIQVVSSGKYLEIPGGNTANGVQVSQWEWHGGANQRFKLVSKIATNLTGVYYLSGNEFKCLKIVANPNGNKQGFEIEPSLALAASDFLSGAGYVTAGNPTRGDAVTFSGATWKEVKFSSVKDGISIGGVTYLKRPTNANWLCNTIDFRANSSVLSGSWIFAGFASNPANCQEILHDQETGAFVMYYPPGVSQSIQSGAGYFEEALNSGLVGGYNPARRDGPFKIRLNAAKDEIKMTNLNGDALGPAFALKKVASCASANYPQVVQCLDGTHCVST